MDTCCTCAASPRGSPEVPVEVAMVDTRVGSFTPVAEWNFREVQRAHRGRYGGRLGDAVGELDELQACGHK